MLKAPHAKTWKASSACAMRRHKACHHHHHLKVTKKMVTMNSAYFAGTAMGTSEIEIFGISGWILIK